MYEVGVDIPAGEYKMYADGYGFAYRYGESDASGRNETITFQNFGYVTLQKGQSVAFSEAYAVPIAEAKPYNPAEYDNKYTAGMYKIGFDAPAGTYETYGMRLGTGFIAEYGSTNKNNTNILKQFTEQIGYIGTYTIKSTSAYFELNEAYGIYKESEQPNNEPVLELESGYYQNGVDFYLAPGTYLLDPYWTSRSPYGDIEVRDKNGRIVLTDSYYDTVVNHSHLPHYTVKIDEGSTIYLSNVGTYFIKQ